MMLDDFSQKMFKAIQKEFPDMVVIPESGEYKVIRESGGVKETSRKMQFEIIEFMKMDEQ